MSPSRLFRRFALIVAVVFGVVAIAIAALLIFQPTLELTRVKELFEEQLTAFVEAPVTVGQSAGLSQTDSTVTGASTKAVSCSSNSSLTRVSSRVGW